MASPFEIALELCASGFSVIPSGGGDSHKAPLYPWAEYQKHRPEKRELDNWQFRDKPKLWGVVTGAISGTVVLDADTPEAMAYLETELGKPHIKTPRRAHWYFKHPGHFIGNAANKVDGIDWRGDGGFVNLIGLRLGYSENGVTYPDADYRIITLPTPESLLPWDKLPANIKAIISENGSKTTPTTAQVGQPIPKDKRNATLISLAGTMRRRGMSEEAILAALLETNRTQCQPPLPDSEVLEIAKSVSRYEPEPSQQGFNLTDAGNAEYFTNLYGNSLRYDHQRGRWLEWQKHYWQPENDGQVMRLALKSVRERYKTAVNVADLKEREVIAKWAIGSEQRARLEAIISIANKLLPIADNGDGWDADPWLLCVKNGVIDLKTGQLRDGKPEDRITMHSPVTFDPDAKAPRWLSFQDEIASVDNDLISWKRKYFGYCLTGITCEQVMAIGYGKGANSKGRESATLRHILGDYAYDAPFTTFELNNRASIPNDMAALAGRRFVTSSETNANSRLNEARIKQLFFSLFQKRPLPVVIGAP